jgi:hypothetical protein
MNDEPVPQINTSKIPMGSGLGGGLAALACMLIIVLGIPQIRLFVPGAIAVGCVVALVLHFVRPKKVGALWILPATKK